MKKTTKLKQMLHSNELGFLMEAHNGLSAKIVENTGFKGIWASGLSISAALGVRDNNEASWTQVLEVIEFMSDATNIPILLDGDTGYGNFNNMRRLVRKLEQRGIAGVCIEDKLFPKTNSFINGEAQPLADIDEFCGKIKAAKDAATDPDFIVVARVEAFIAGWGLEEAVKRAEAYRQAGADAILMHSKRADATEIKAFMEVWDNRHPVIIVPTKYYSTPTEQFSEWGVSTVIWANHNVRAAIKAMEQVTQKIFTDQSLINVEGNIASVSHIFELQGAEELKEAEKKYLPAYGQQISAVILAASQGEDFDTLTTQLPKTLLSVNNKSIFDSQVELFNEAGVKDIIAVRGFGKEHFKQSNITFIDNDCFNESKELYSLNLALNNVKDSMIVSYGDILFKPFILNELLTSESAITIIVDSDVDYTKTGYKDYILATEKYDRRKFNQKAFLKNMSNGINSENVDGEFIGLCKFTATGLTYLKNAIRILSEIKPLEEIRFSEVLTYLAKEHAVSIKYIRGSWIDVDNVIELQKAGEI
ncbi:phosphoenolpyruvate mutase [Solibacillus daqui]|uniref:phosphoenolpyruvate mutase n=1 Tax=Solibacillus daqui TaxID=2912187 RepID=UPI00236722DB|nr:phosphoenolpyruvate mutase [Solibacillus daqui]